MKTYNQKSDPMVDPRINLLNRADNQYPRGKRIFKVSKFILYLFIVLVLAFVVFSYQVLFTNNSVNDIFSGKINIFQQLNSLAGEGNQLQGESDDRINILLLGMGGAGHEGPYLTDTVILASIKPSTKQIGMVSIPRDLLTEIPGFGWWKINNANAFGEKQSPGNGGELVKQVVNQVFELPIHYYVRIDFAGFEKIIDDVGGIKVSVDTSFTDFQYPTLDYKYQVVSFEQGWQTMDGDAALKFARSRHGSNGEGSDFARSQRQQKILQAFKSRIFSYSFLLSPRKIKKFTSALAGHIRTDLEPWELVKLAKLAEKIDTENIITRVLDDSPGGFLYANIVNEAYVLQPKGDDFTQIQYVAKNIFKGQEILEQKKVITVEILNGTTIAGLASRNLQELKLVGYRVNKIGNSPKQNYTNTVVYKLSQKNAPEEEKFLASKYNTDIQKNNIPDWAINMAGLDLDFLIILGQDVAE
ncbi:LCP family protein [Candidatus Falkowbacteria bacterium]|jgi:polyisoprenyl-teichoic acid--peptidoglycan teichoic acid transferase|nr:LCP family protein [Candidatus Falkowbacteria bacterium]MBT5503623.1 LCP family protein [Candidatus Falkowbacteria bacterium]MBT6574483.1 LCP family protein [Candidatus Falkowbacteria bacterium]MBT7348107.1 LCP family protein [Candidatus Falkowbacteria bacterium]MBT7500750.1 LCP family protein [Candidatus Falkowbacteria bacterium]